MSVEDSTLQAFQHVATTLQWVKDHPHGPAAGSETRVAAGQACVKLAGGQDCGRTLWRVVADACGGYMPHAAAIALIHASKTENLVPDVTAPDPS